MNSSSPRLFHVAAEQDNLPILSALRKWNADASWNDLRKLLRARHITVNGNLCLDEGRRVRIGEVIKILPNSLAPPPKDQDVRIRYADPQLVIVEKPAGMTTLRHSEERNYSGHRRQLQPTLDEVLPRILQKKLPAAPQREMPEARRKGNAARRGMPRRLRPVHRLDRDTSGLMVFARTIDAEHHLGLQFRAHSIHRVYLAIVRGNIDSQTIVSDLVVDRGDGRRGSTRIPQEGSKRAVTHVRPLEKLNGYTVVECRLETGRTHQIRIHLSEAGHPVCGDKVYRGPFPGKPLQDDSGAPRLALHAAELGFEHPVSGDHIRFSMPLPTELYTFLKRLRSVRGTAANDNGPSPFQQIPVEQHESFAGPPSRVVRPESSGEAEDDSDEALMLPRRARASGARRIAERRPQPAGTADRKKPRKPHADRGQKKSGQRSANKSRGERPESSARRKDGGRGKPSRHPSSAAPGRKKRSPGSRRPRS